MKEKEIEFEYKALDKKQQVVKGIKKSTDEFNLKKDLSADGFVLLHAEPVSKFSLMYYLNRKMEGGRISTREKIIFCRNLGAMLGAGLALSRSLSIIERQSSNKKLKKVVQEINEKVKKGGTLSNSLKDYPKYFPAVMVSMIEAGEESGKLVESLEVISNQMDKQDTLNKKIQGAMVYPGVIISAMLIIAIFMLVYIVPTLTKTFSELNVELPATTKFVINFSGFVQANLALAGAIFLGIIVLVYLLLKSQMGKKAIDWLFLHTPVISDLVKEINAARTTRTLASLLASGVSYVRSLQIVHEVVQNSYHKDVIKKAEKNIQLGLPISKVFEENQKIYPVFVSEMMAVGEETGELSPMLLKVALFYEDEVEQKTKNLSTIVEPFLMIVVGAAVGFFAISMISPMYSLVNQI